MASSGSFSGSIYNGHYALRVDWSQSINASANTSTITARIYLVNDYSLSIGARTNNTITIDGQQQTFSSPAVSTTGSHLLSTVTQTVSHDSDGAKSVTMKAVFNINATLSGTYYSTITASGTVTLDTIPRASTIGATNANIGSTSTITVSRKSTGYTHSVAYKFGGLSGYVTSSGGTSSTESKFSAEIVKFTVPTAFYAQIPNAKTGTCTLTCKTYSGSTQIGSAQTCDFTVTASESICKPTVAGTVVDSNAATKALTGNENILVRYHSTALCTISAAPKNSATIASKAISGTQVSGNTRSIANVDTGSFQFSATDSRGYSGSATVTKTLVKYIPLSLNPTITRSAPTEDKATLRLKGNCFNGSFGARSNTLTVTYRSRQSGGSYGSAVTVAATQNGDTWSATASLTGLDYTSAWEIEVTAKDALETVTKVVTLTRGVPVFDWGESDFCFNVPITTPTVNGIYIQSKRAWGIRWVEIQTNFSEWDASGGLRQSILFFAANSSGGVDHGIIYVSNTGSCKIVGGSESTVEALDGGRIRLTTYSPYPWYDYLTFISATYMNVL